MGVTYLLKNDWIVDSTGTLVNMLVTSNDASIPFGLIARRMLKKSSRDFIEYFRGMYGFVILSSCLATL